MDMYPDGEWNDRPCSDRLAYVCEVEVGWYMKYHRHTHNLNPFALDMAAAAAA